MTIVTQIQFNSKDDIQVAQTSPNSFSSLTHWGWERMDKSSIKLNFRYCGSLGVTRTIWVLYASYLIGGRMWFCPTRVESVESSNLHLKTRNVRMFADIAPHIHISYTTHSSNILLNIQHWIEKSINDQLWRQVLCVSTNFSIYFSFSHSIQTLWRLTRAVWTKFFIRSGSLFIFNNIKLGNKNEFLM